MLYARNKKNNKNNAHKSYRALNMHAKKSKDYNEIKVNNVPTPEVEIPENSELGYLAVGVYTALGALPVKDAVVTVYTIDENGEEVALYHLITDVNGRIPNVELPVAYIPGSQLESPEYFYTKYNMRVQAENYNTFNVREIRIFPNITTDYNVNLVPMLPGTPEKLKEYNIIIPPSPIDESNV